MEMVERCPRAGMPPGYERALRWLRGATVGPAPGWPIGDPHQPSVVVDAVGLHSDLCARHGLSPLCRLSPSTAGPDCHRTTD